MSKAILIIGNSGTGKSTAIRTLPSEETFIINVIGKPLPFKGANKKYTPAKGEEGNCFQSEDHKSIMQVINFINNKKLNIHYLIIDDFGYSITSDFMKKALVKGYDKFSELAHSAWEVLQLITSLRDDLFVFVMMHSDIDNEGKSKPKTIGKMLDERVCIEGMFSICLHSFCADGQYRFLTNNHGNLMAKSPMDMFDNLTIPNDLKLVVDHVNAYLNEDIEI